ncbi:peritrophin-1-like [Bombus vosnesenskii]|uniref:Peritrophin-1-like n=1 Tax=Bombus vosnesenskii TaxID=207650 RepID=A0A6J3L669_9HYME|nr:peritrophin-1-like [Bombus vosnesenskii]XP_050481468.1 peritrophin-1-like [Bombus huntii]
MKAIFVVALTALLVAFVSATPPPECPDESEEDVALFPNPDDCTSYYTCIRDQPLLMQCHQGLEYNPVLRICDWPKKNVTCKRRPVRPPHPPHQSQASTSKSTKHVDIGRMPA